MGRLKNKTLFSLIELLIVVAIIIILISLLQPALRNIINNAHSTACLNNLREINLAQLTYSDDHHGKLPTQNPTTTGHRSCPYFWDKEILVDVFKDDYGVNLDTLVCPSRDLEPIYTDERNPVWGGDYFVAYAYLIGLPSATVGSFYESKPSAAKINMNENTPESIAIADLNMKFLNSKLTLVNHSSMDFEYKNFGPGPNEMFADTFYEAEMHEFLKAISGSNRMHVDGSGKWVTLDVMGKDNSYPDPSDHRTSRYDHWNDIRPYYW